MYNTFKLQIFALTCYVFLIYTFLIKPRLLYLVCITFLNSVFLCGVPSQPFKFSSAIQPVRLPLWQFRVLQFSQRPKPAEQL